MNYIVKFIYFIAQALEIDCHFCYPGGSQALLHDAINEIAEHQEFYGPFLSPGWRKELEEYVEKEEYDKDVVDLLIHALCNVTQTSCQIITHQANDIHVEETLLPSRSRRLPSRDIVLCRVGSHYPKGCINIAQNVTQLMERFIPSHFQKICFRCWQIK